MSKRRILFYIIWFILGFIVSTITEQYLISTIEYLYKTTSNGKINVIGKYFSFLSAYDLYVMFGIAFVLLAKSMNRTSFINILKQKTLFILLFVTILSFITLIDGRLRQLLCTNCIDNTLTVMRTSIKYNILIGSSSLLSSCILLYSKVRRDKNKEFDSTIID